MVFRNSLVVQMKNYSQNYRVVIADVLSPRNFLEFGTVHEIMKKFEL